MENTEAKNFFNPLVMQKANRLLKLGKVSLSFQKGDFDGFLIATGIVKDNSTHGHLKIEPSVGIGTIREIWVYRAVETSVQMPIQDLQNNISQQEPVVTQLPIPFLGPVFLLEESFAPSPFTKVTSTFPVQIAEEDAFYVLIRFSDKDVEYVETFFVRQE